jgi:hypothetical protein
MSFYSIPNALEGNVESSEDFLNSDLALENYQTSDIIMETSENLILQDIELSELGLEEYEPNEFVLETVHYLKLFFNNSSNCSCRKKNRICFEKIGFKNFFERHMELKGLGNNELDLCIKTQLIFLNIN